MVIRLGVERELKFICLEARAMDRGRSFLRLGALLFGRCAMAKGRADAPSNPDAPIHKDVLLVTCFQGKHRHER